MGRASLLLASLVLAVAAGQLVGQEAPTPTPTATPAPTPGPGVQPAPPQEDKAPITSIVETWLKYMETGEHKGYIHERISPVPIRHYRYEYLWEGDRDVRKTSETGDEESEHESWQCVAQLTEDFEPHTLELAASRGAFTWRMTVRTSEDKRLIELSFPQLAEGKPGDVYRLEVEVDSPIGTLPQLLLYKLRQQGGLAKPSNVPYRFVGTVAGAAELVVTCKVEEAVLKNYLGDKPSFVTPVLMENAPTESAVLFPWRAFVDKYGRMVEAVGADESIRYVIAKDAMDARGGEAKLAQRGRRDPFSKLGALTPVGQGPKEGTKGPKGPEPPLVIPPEKIGEKLMEAGQLVDKLEQFVRENNPQAEQVYQKFLRLYEVLRRMCAGDPVKLNQLDGYKAKAEQIYGGAERLVRQAQKLLDDIEDYYNALDDKRVEEAVAKLKALRARREFFQDERVVEMDKIIKVAEQKLAQTRARIELRAKRLDLSGVVFQANVVRELVDMRISIMGPTLQVSEPVKVVHNLAYAVINDELYREGEEVHGQSVMIDKIQPHGVTVSYKGEVREVPLKKREPRTK